MDAGFGLLVEAVVFHQGSSDEQQFAHHRPEDLRFLHAACSALLDPLAHRALGMEQTHGPHGEHAANLAPSAPSRSGASGESGR